MDTLITSANEVKSLGNGRFAGFLVRFSDDTQPDLSGDYFTSETDFGLLPGEVKSTPVYYNHALDPTLKTRKIGMATMQLKDAGVWFEGELEKSDAYIASVEKLLGLNRLGASSGTASHLVERETSGKASHVKHWPLGLDASLTTSPCDPYNHVVSIKSVEASLKSIPDLLREIELEDKTDEQQNQTPPAPETKAAPNIETPFANATADVVSAAFDRLSSRLSSFIYSELYGDAYWGSCSMTGMSNVEQEPIDRAEIAQSLTDFSQHVLTVLDAMLARGQSVTPAEVKTLLSYFKPVEAQEVADSLNALPLKTYLPTMRRVLEGFSQRVDFVANKSASAQKSGRVLSKENLTAMRDIRDGMKDTHKQMGEHIATMTQMLDKHDDAEKSDKTDAKDTQKDNKPPSAQSNKEMAQMFTRYLAIDARNMGGQQITF